MQTTGSYLVNDATQPVRFGEVNLINPPRRERRGLPEKTGLLCRTVLTGFCGTDWELMQMGQRGELGAKFPEGQSRLVNGHEGVVWVPQQQRYAVVLIRGGDSYDPSRFAFDETYFEYGCDGADGLMAHEGYYHPDMLLRIPEAHLSPQAILTRTLGMRLSFADPMACMIFQRERLEDLLLGHNWRVYASQGMSREEAMQAAVHDGFARVVIYGLGSTGLLGAIAIKEQYPHAQVVTVARAAPGNEKHSFIASLYPDLVYVQATSDVADTASRIRQATGGPCHIFIGASATAREATIAFGHGVLDNNGIYASFSLGPTICYDSMPFGFKNQLIFGAINFRREHMEEAIRLLGRLPLEQLCREYPLDGFAKDPMELYQEIYRSPSRAFKSVVVWDQERIQ